MTAEGEAMSSTFVAKNAAGYEQLMGRWSRRLAQPFLDFSDLQNCKRILDVGCGTGSLSKAMADRHPSAESIVGIDLSPAYVDFAKAAGADLRIVYQVADACSLDFETGQFDAAVSLLVLTFIPDYQSAAAEMLRVTNSGGRISAAVWDNFGGLVFMRMFWDTAVMLDAEAAAFRARGMASPLAQEGRLADTFRELGGLDVEECDLLMRMQYENFDDFWLPFLAGDAPAGAYVANLSEEKRERFRSALRDAYCAGRDDGPRRMVAVARAVRCRAPES
jgi:SAM-dependent methyltransferase